MASVATSQAEEVAAPSPAPAPAPAADAAAVDDGSTADSDRGGGAWRRWAPGSKAAAYASWKDVELKDMKEPFAVQQYIQQLIRRLRLQKGNTPQLCSHEQTCSRRFTLRCCHHMHVS